MSASRRAFLSGVVGSMAYATTVGVVMARGGGGGGGGGHGHSNDHGSTATLPLCPKSKKLKKTTPLACK